MSYAESAPSLFDFDIVIADIDAVLPAWCQEKCPENEYLEAKDRFYDFEKLIDKLRKEATFLLKRDGVLVCIMKPKRGISHQFYSRTSGGYRWNYLNNYDWVPI